MDESKRNEIIEKLREKGANRPCPRCGNTTFSIIDGYFNQTIQDDFSGFLIGGQSIPSAITACNNCGYLAQHALGILGLLDKKGGGNG